MVITPDDEIYRVDEVFLGPEKFRFPWRWTYRQYGVAVVAYLAIQGLERQLGIPFGMWSALFPVLLVAWIARVVQDGINWDRGLKVMANEARLELVGPREQTKTIRTVIKARRGRKNRAHLLTEVYGPDEQSSQRDDLPSWWSQFKRTGATKPKKRKRSSRKKVDDQQPHFYEPRSGDSDPVAELGGRTR